MTTLPRRVLLAVATASFVGVMAACGVPADESPRSISDEALPAELTDRPSATTTIPPELAEPAEIFLVVEEDENSKLVSVPRQVRRDQSLEGKIRSVLEGLVRRSGGEADPGPSNYVPSTASILGVYLDRDTGRLTVNLSSDMGQVANRGLPLAYAQLVYTATQFEGVDSVAFRIDGQDGPVPNGEGQSTSVVRRSDYRNFAPAPA